MRGIVVMGIDWSDTKKFSECIKSGQLSIVENTSGQSKVWVLFGLVAEKKMMALLGRTFSAMPLVESAIMFIVTINRLNQYVE